MEIKLDDFDLLNEALTAWQIVEWFKKENPEPEIPEDERHQSDSLAWDMWEQWQKELVLYANGWKDALRALEWRRQMEKDINHINYLLRWFNDNPAQIILWRWESDEEFGPIRDSEDIDGELWCEMMVTDVDLEEEFDVGDRD